MLRWLKRRNETARTAGELYGRVVAAARQPVFYREFGVPDTPEGRFELVALHLFMALEALRRSAPRERGIPQRTIEAFVTDIDDCMREMGVGDVVVPKRVRRAAGAFYERAGAYRAALERGTEDAIAEVLQTYVYEGQGSDDNVSSLARYVVAENGTLAGQDVHAMFESHI